MTRVALALALAVTGCARCSKSVSIDAGPDEAWLAGRYVEADAGAPRRGGSLTVRLPIEPLGFSRIHDRFGEGTMVRATTGTIYESFARIDATNPDGPLLPWLARSWSLDGGSLRLELEPDVLFHDGTTFDANDAKAVFDVVLAPKNSTVSVRSSIGEPSSVTVLDAGVLEIHWSRPAPTLVVRSLLSSVPMMPSEALVGSFDELPIHRAPIGTGPFSFRSVTSGQGFVVERFDRHRQPAWLDAINFRVVKDDTVATQLWEKGEFDVMTRIPPSVWREVESKPWAFTGYQRVRIDENAYAWFGWNEQRSPFSDVRVRRALAMLYPAETVSRVVELGLETRTTCPFLVGSKSCDSSIGPLPFDPAKAKALLDEAGWREADGVRMRDGKPLEFSFLLVSTSARLSRVLALYQEQLALAGVRMTLEPVDAAQSISRMRTHEFDGAAMIWSSPDAVTDQFDLFHSSQADGGKNYVGFSNAEADALLLQIRAEQDVTERQRLERSLHRLLFEQQVYLFLTARPALDAVKRRVHGIRPSLAWYDLARVWVEP